MVAVRDAHLHFPYGEMTILLEHWALLSGLIFGGEPIVGKGVLGYARVPELLGRPTPDQTRSTYNFRASWLQEWSGIWPDPVPSSAEAAFVLRHFLLDLLGVVFCDVSGYCVHANWLVYLADLGELWRYDWGGTSYAYLLCSLDNVVCKNHRLYVGLYPLITVSVRLASVLHCFQLCLSVGCTDLFACLPCSTGRLSTLGGDTTSSASVPSFFCFPDSGASQITWRPRVCTGTSRTNTFWISSRLTR